MICCFTFDFLSNISKYEKVVGSLATILNLSDWLREEHVVETRNYYMYWFSVGQRIEYT